MRTPALLAALLTALAACDGSVPAETSGYRNATYLIEGRPVTLSNGIAERDAAPGSASRIVTRLQPAETWGDLNADGRDDVVLFLSHQLGGSGTFYYVVAAVDTAIGFAGSDAVLLGDRVVPQAVTIRDDGIVVVTYLDRGPGESMAAAPSVERSRWIRLNPASMRFGEVARDFEGEADPARMRLGMKTWVWQSAQMRDGNTIAPSTSGIFTLHFDDGAVAVTTDCNLMSGNYTEDGTGLHFGNMSATRMFCAGSQEQEFARLLGNTVSYRFSARGELILALDDGNGELVFR